MPLYDYVCSDCGEQFEALVLGSNKASCPACQSQNLEQQLSLFGVSSEGTRERNIQLARQGNKKTQRDRIVAEQEAMHHDDH